MATQATGENPPRVYFLACYMLAAALMSGVLSEHALEHVPQFYSTGFNLLHARRLSRATNVFDKHLHRICHASISLRVIT